MSRVQTAVVPALNDEKNVANLFNMPKNAKNGAEARFSFAPLPDRIRFYFFVR